MLILITSNAHFQLADCKLQKKGSMSKSNTAKSHDRKQFDRVYKTGGKTKINKRNHIRPKLLKEDAKKPSNHKYKTDGQIKMDRQDHVRPPKLQNKDDEKPFVHTSKADSLKKSHTKDKFRPKLQKSKVSIISRFTVGGRMLEGGAYAACGEGWVWGGGGAHAALQSTVFIYRNEIGSPQCLVMLLTLTLEIN